MAIFSSFKLCGLYLWSPWKVILVEGKERNFRAPPLDSVIRWLSTSPRQSPGGLPGVLWPQASLSAILPEQVICSKQLPLCAPWRWIYSHAVSSGVVVISLFFRRGNLNYFLKVIKSARGEQPDSDPFLGQQLMCSILLKKKWEKDLLCRQTELETESFCSIWQNMNGQS